MIVISANQLTKLYGVDEILTDVSFHINAGDRVGIVGANGAGKVPCLIFFPVNFRAIPEIISFLAISK